VLPSLAVATVRIFMVADREFQWLTLLVEISVTFLVVMVLVAIVEGIRFSDSRSSVTSILGNSVVQLY